LGTIRKEICSASVSDAKKLESPHASARGGFCFIRRHV
jgi:hypothetical protein